MEPQKFVTPNTQLRRKYLPTPSTRKDQSFAQYIELLKAQGLEINPKCFPSFFALKNGLEYPGIACSQKITANQVLVRVPKKLVLSSFRAIQLPQLQQVFKERFYHQDWAWQDRVLNTYLLYIYGQNQTSNIWYHLVKHLPKEIDIIGFWPKEDLKKFKDLTVKSAALQDSKSFEEEWTEFEQVKQKHQILQNQTFSKQNYKWIFIHLISRCFGKQLEFTSMVPFCQLFNHHAVDGHYDVEILPRKEQNQPSETSSITTEGSYLSEDYIQTGEFAYEQINSKPYTWICKEKYDLNQKQKKIIQNFAFSILKGLENDLNWQDVTIMFVPHMIQRCKLIETEYKAGRRNFKIAHEDLKTIQEGINFYRENIAKSYKSWRGKTFVYKTHADIKKEQEQKKSKQVSNPHQQSGIIQFPTQQKRHYDNFLLLTGHRDHYQPPNQVYFCYGRNSNRTLLLRYGFAIEGNKYQHVWLSFDIVNSLVHYPDTIQQLEEKHLSLRRKFKIKINRLNMELILFFRLISWAYFGKSSIEELFKVKDYAKEISTLVQLKESLESKHKTFQGPYDLTDPKLSYHEYFIAVYHQQKQKILSQHIGFLKTLIKMLKNLEKGANLSKATQQFTAQEKFIFRHYLNQLE